MENALNVVLSFVKANFLAALVVFFLYLIERNSEWILFVKQFKWKKSQKNARIHRHRDQVYYFIFCILVYIYDIYNNNIHFTAFSFTIWFTLLIVFSTFFGKLYYKYQGVDPNKADDDFSM